MHIPSSMLNGAVCPVTIVVAAVGVSAAVYCAAKTKEKPSSSKFAAVTSLIFAMQMLNYPVQSGTSGHLIGGILAVGLLGIPFAVLAMTVVLAVQTIFFADGGINALGANVLNMSLIAAGVGGFLLRLMAKKGIDKKISLGIISLVSVLLAALACSFEVAASGTIQLSKVLPAMLSVHVLIGFGEGLLTVAVYSALVSCESFWKENKNVVVFGAMILSFLGTLFSPLASGFPDGLERVAEKLSFKVFSAFELPALFPDYQAFFLAGDPMATISAGMLGAGIVFLSAYAIGGLIKTNKLETA